MTILIQKFRNICLIFSGTDPHLYAFCPKNEKIKRVVMGASVLFVGIFAFISMTMFVLTLFQNYNTVTKETNTSFLGMILSPVIGMLWAAFIIVIDMTILSAKSTWTALIRIPIAIALGFVIAIPLEMNICSGYLNRELVIDNQTANSRYESEYKEATRLYQERVQHLQNTVEKHSTEMTKWSDIMDDEAVGRVKAGRTGKAGRGLAYEEAERNFHLHKQMHANAKTDLDAAKAELKEIQSGAMQRLQNKEVSASLDFLSQYTMMHKIRSRKENEHIDSLCLAITLIFIALELTPALLKLSNGFSKKQGIYEVLESARDQIVLQSTIITTNEAMKQVAQHNYDIFDPTKSLDKYSPKGLMQVLEKNI
jgi:hypothetical protein